MVEWNGLENRQTGNGLVGSNPTLSAKKQDHHFSIREIFSRNKIPNTKAKLFFARRAIDFRADREQ